MSGLLRRLRRTLRLGRRSLGYDEEKKLACHGNARARARLAARADLRPEILYFLAEDSVPEVRRNIAANARTPAQADMILARDGDAGVRCDLAEKIAGLAPRLSADEQDRVKKLTYQALEILARDQMTRVRQVLAETLKDVADAPPEIIGRLARDGALDVAEPVLRHSQVLTDADLLEIIHDCATPGALAAISRRDGVGGGVADAIVAADDVAAVTALLGNPSAQIREETLDRIIDRAPDVEAWHGPLVRRPNLPNAAVGRIARFVAGSLIAVLEARGDLDPATLTAVRKEMDRRLAQADGRRLVQADGRRRDEDGGPRRPPAEDAALALDRARSLHAGGQLGEDAISGALSSGDRHFAAAALAVLSGQPLALVNKIADAHSAKGITALCWKAGLGARFAVKLQLRFAHITPLAALNPREGDIYPLVPEDMDWQLDFFASIVSPGA